LTGTETAECYEAIYTIAGQKLGPLLIDNNVVLTFAGARGSTNLYLPYYDDSFWQQAMLLDKMLRSSHGIAITPYRIPLDSSALEQTIVLLIENLRGYAYVSERTGIPGVLPFTVGSVNEWMYQTMQGMKRAHKQGQFNFPAMYLEKLFDGIIEGYPDQALYDAIDWQSKGKQAVLVSADIPYRLYSGCRHSFSFYPEHAHNPNIAQTTAVWTTILTKFYTSPWFTGMRDTYSFQKAREISREADQKTRLMLRSSPTGAAAK
jgi:hypothetical protein